MAKKYQPRGKGSYEVWSRRQARAWMGGMGSYEDYGAYVMLPPSYRTSECLLEDELYFDGKTFRPVRGRKKVRIFEDDLNKLGRDRTAVVIDPLELMRSYFYMTPGKKGNYPYDPEERRRAEKYTKAFLRQFPDLASPDFNGSLVLHDAMVEKGLKTTLAFQEKWVYQPELSIVLKDNHVLVTFCDDDAIHVEARSRLNVEKFVSAYRRHTQLEMAIIQNEF